MIMRTVVQLHNRQRCGSTEPFCTNVAHCLFTTSAGRLRFELHAHNENYDLSNARIFKRMHPASCSSGTMRRACLIGVVGFLDDTAHGKSPTTPARGGRGYWHNSCSEGIYMPRGRLGDRAPEIGCSLHRREGNLGRLPPYTKGLP